MSAEASLSNEVRMCMRKSAETDVTGSSQKLEDSTIETIESYACTRCLPSYTMALISFCRESTESHLRERRSRPTRSNAGRHSALGVRVQHAQAQGKSSRKEAVCLPPAASAALADSAHHIYPT
jgi:hypothetical protein